MFRAALLALVLSSCGGCAALQPGPHRPTAEACGATFHLPANYSKRDRAALMHQAEAACEDMAAWLNDSPHTELEPDEAVDPSKALKGWTVDVTALSVDGVHHVCGENTAGCWSPRQGRHKITLREQSRGVNGGVRVFYHEMQHALMYAVAGVPVENHHLFMKLLGWY